MTSLLSGFAGALLYSLVQGYWMWKQIQSSERAMRELIRLLLEERNMLNSRFGAFESGLQNIATALGKSKG